MKIEITMPQLHKNYIIVAMAIEAPRLKGWKLKGSSRAMARTGLRMMPSFHRPL